MGELSVGDEEKLVQSVEELALRFHTEVFQKLPQWQQQLSTNPAECQTLELEVHREFRRGADLVMAGLLAVVMKLSSFEEACEQTRTSYEVRLTKGRMRKLKLRLLGGLIIWVRSMYCEPRAGLLGKAPRQDVPGLYIELAQFGFAKGCSPGMEELIARRVASCHSFDFAMSELRRDGLEMNYKAVRRIAYQCGEGILTLRSREIAQWRKGKLLCTNELAGKRIVAQIDGGRMKIRGDLIAKPEPAISVRKVAGTSPDEEVLAANSQLAEDGGRSKAKQHRKQRKRYAADWREPKLFTIFTIDENGKQTVASQTWIEGTLEGPDAIAEIVAMRLFQLGAQQASCLTFVSDGAPWIWDRLDRIVALLKLPVQVPVYRVLDCCHAIHHVHLGCKQLGYSPEITQGLYRAYRKQIRDGLWHAVVQDLRTRAAAEELSAAAVAEITRVCSYLERHGQAGHMNYPLFSIMGLPIGSGAIESSIRRVINLRLKSNGMFWKADNAEAILQLRCHYVSKRLDSRLQAKRLTLASNGKRDWSWEPQDMRTNTDHLLNTSA